MSRTTGFSLFVYTRKSNSLEGHNISRIYVQIDPMWGGFLGGVGGYQMEKKGPGICEGGEEIRLAAARDR